MNGRCGRNALIHGLKIKNRKWKKMIDYEIDKQIKRIKRIKSVSR